MTPNLASARQAIEAELSHARQGMAFYSARVEALETALTQLESVESDESAPVKKSRGKSAAANNRQKGGESKRGRAPRREKGGNAGHAASAASSSATASRQGKRSRQARAASPSRDAAGLPTTGTDFWLKIVTDEPKSAVEIANAAAETLGIAPDQKEQIQKLKQRVAPALATLVSTQKIQDSGTGRERRFFKETGQAA